MKELEYWLDESEVKKMFSSDYWNNIENEKKKEWWIETDTDTKVEKYLENKGLKEEFELALSSVNLKGKVLDLAAGTCWTSAYLSKEEDIEEIDAVEFSLHRIKDLAPTVIKSLGGSEQKINRYLGSFYDIKRDDEYYDIIVLSQAYHHAEFPLKLFHECDRVLNKGGSIIIIGEHIIGKWKIFKRWLKNLSKGKYSIDVYEEFYNHDDPLGDHYYLENDYKFTFYAYGYELKTIKSNIRNSHVFIGKKHS